MSATIFDIRKQLMLTKLLPFLTSNDVINFGMVVMDQSLIVVGGYPAYDKMEKIGLNDNKWVEEDLPLKVWGHCLVSINETTMMAIGGIDGSGNVSKRYFEFVNETKNLKREEKQLQKNF